MTNSRPVGLPREAWCTQQEHLSAEFRLTILWCSSLTSPSAAHKLTQTPPAVTQQSLVTWPIWLLQSMDIQAKLQPLPLSYIQVKKKKKEIDFAYFLSLN